MDNHSYVNEILEAVLLKNGHQDPLMRENTFQRLFLGYGVITEEISKEIAMKEYQDKGIHP